jgi:hypothetical protein
VEVGNVYVWIGGQQKPLAAHMTVCTRYCPKTCTIQVGQKVELILVDWLKAHTSSRPFSPVEATSHSCPPKKLASAIVKPATS